MGKMNPYLLVFALFLFVLALPPVTLACKGSSTELKEPETSWFSCETTNDCMIIYGHCHRAESVNRRYFDDYRHYIHNGPVPACMLAPTYNTISLQCKSNRCRTETTSPSD